MIKYKENLFEEEAMSRPLRIEYGCLHYCRKLKGHTSYLTNKYDIIKEKGYSVKQRKYRKHQGTLSNMSNKRCDPYVSI